MAADATQAGSSPFFLTRGVVLVVRDLETLDWPARARRAGLTTLATHIFPHEVAAYLATDGGRRMLSECRRLGLHVEHELHAMSDLLPRELFARDPSLFRMTEEGARTPDWNLCVHSEAALEIVAENAERYTRLLPSTTGRYFYWVDDGRPMCRCPRCRGYSDSDQALLAEHVILKAIRRVDSRATLAHLAYATTLEPPACVRPEPGIFLEFAPIQRRHDRPLRDRSARQGNGPDHGELLDLLDANLAVFGADGAQALEYWLDASRAMGWRRDAPRALPWARDVFLDDLDTYACRGVRHVTSFAAWIDGDYVARFGEPPIEEYGAGLRVRRAGHGPRQGPPAAPEAPL